MAILWWARRRTSTYARRYAWASLSLDGVMLLVLLPYSAAFALAVPLEDSVNTAFVLVGAVLWLVQLFLCGIAVALAVRGFRGRDVGDRLLPDWIVRRLPSTAPVA